MTTATCKNCEENNAHPNGNGLCENCCKPSTCEQCSCSLDDDEIQNAGWNIENQIEVRCEECSSKNETEEWIEATESAVEDLCEAHGWEIEKTGGGFNTSSRYYEIFREDGEGNLESFKLRISDHGSAHCSEDISLSMIDGGDDHSLETLVRRLQR